MKRFLVVLCIFTTAIVALSTAVYALPSFRGYTGLLVVPTAGALNKGDFNVGASSEDVGDTFDNIYGNYGLANGLEVGLNARQEVFEGSFYDEETDTYHHFEHTERDTLINAKYRFLCETNSHPAVAAGIIDLTNEEETTVYVVASKTITTPLAIYHGEVINPSVHIGFGAGEFESLFFGVSTYLGTRIEVMGEWDSEFWNAGAKFRLTPGLALDAGFFRIGKGTDFGLGGSFSRSF